MISWTLNQFIDKLLIIPSVYPSLQQSIMDNSGDRQENTPADDGDFSLCMSSVKEAVKAIFKTSRREVEQPAEPVVWDDSECYTTTSGRCGIALVVINETFRGHQGRSGSQLDADNLSRTFSSLGFEVRLVKDCALKEFKQVLEKVAQEDHSESDCFVLAVSSHGDELRESQKKQKAPRLSKTVREDVVYCTDHYMTTRELVLHFSDAKCPTLKGKPRLFFLQACRGGQLDAGLDIRVVTSDAATDEEVDVKTEDAADDLDGKADLPEVIVSPAPCFKDFLVMCATPPGYFAFRRPVDGSWFIQALCCVLEECDDKRDVLHQLTRVVNLVAHHYKSRVPGNPEQDGKKQTPVIYSMLTKDLHWTKADQPGKILTWE